MKNSRSENVQRRKKRINLRPEATQDINPLNGQGYLEYSCPKLRRFEDPIQGHLRRMEEENPSENTNYRGFLREAGDRLTLMSRGQEYHEGNMEIYRMLSIQEPGFGENITYIFSKKIIEYPSISNKKFPNTTLKINKNLK